MGKRRILFLGDVQAQNGGPFKSNLELAKFLDMKCKLTVVGSVRGGISKQYSSLNVLTYTRICNNGVLSTLSLRGLSKFKQDEVVVGHLFNLTGWLYSLVYIIKPLTIYSRGELLALNRFKFLALKIFLLRPKLRLIVLNEKEREIAFDKFGLKATVSANVLSELDFAAIKDLMFNSVYVVSDRIRALYIGRLHPDKGVEHLINIKALANNRLDLYVFGIARTTVERDVHEFLSKKMAVQGPIYGSRKYLEMIKADIFLLPSKREGFSMAILEAVASGCLVVTTTEANVPNSLLEFCYVLPYETFTTDLEKLLSSSELHSKIKYCKLNGLQAVETEFVGEKKFIELYD